MGVLVGPAGLGWVAVGTELELLASLGIAVLLFLVGLKLEPKLIRTTGRVALATGLGQVAFASIFGFTIALALGLDVVPAIYVAVPLAFSSTIIIVELLSDKREIDTLHGRIAIGILIVQDILVILALIVVTALGDDGGDAVGSQLVLVFARGVAFLLILAALMRWVIPPLVGSIARNRELLILFSVARAITLATASDMIGLSIEVGAFLAGVSLAQISEFSLILVVLAHRVGHVDESVMRFSRLPLPKDGGEGRVREARGGRWAAALISQSH